MTSSTRLPTKPATIPSTPAPDWTDAPCRQVDPDLFFPVGHTVGWMKQIDDAKRICRACPVRAACLEWALSTNQWSGIWGGTTEDERRTLVRDRVDRARTYELCIKEQEYIERRLSQAATHREIGDELGVGHSAVSRAVRYFKAERAAAVAGEVAA